MTKKIICFVLGAMLLALGVPVDAQQGAKIPRIGFLVASFPSFYSNRIEAFRQGLRELGYVEGKNIAIEYRFSEGKEDRLRELAAELVRLKVDIVVAAGGGELRRTQQRRSRSSLLQLPTQSRVGLLPAWRGRAEMLRG